MVPLANSGNRPLASATNFFSCWVCWVEKLNGKTEAVFFLFFFEMVGGILFDVFLMWYISVFFMCEDTILFV